MTLEFVLVKRNLMINTHQNYLIDPQGQTLKTEDEFPYMPIFFRDWGCQMDPENLENLDVDSEEDLRNDAMYNIMLDKWQR